MSTVLLKKYVWLKCLLTYLFTLTYFVSTRAEKDRVAKEQREKGLKPKKSFFSFSGSASIKEEAAANAEPEDEREDQDEIDALLLSSKKLEAQRREMEQLQVSLTSAQIFFKRTDVDT